LRIPWWAVAITVVVLVSSVFQADAVRDAATLAPLDEARLDVSAAYLSIAPLSSVLDTLTLMTVAQHIALLLTAIALYAAARVLRAQWRDASVRREVVAATAFLVVIILIYVVGALAPRPMAALAVSDETVLAIDFHAHTMYSHDGRPGWTEDDVRQWHRGAGYDAVYVTDHRTFEGAERGIAANPGLAGEGTMILQGLEAVYRGEHVNLLSAGRRYRGLTDSLLRDVDERSLALASFIAPTAPVIIETVPANLDRVPVLTPNGPGVTAIEIVDGSPRGLAQTRASRKRIVHIADSLNLALVTGSDNHGWGRAAPGWTLMRIPGWRGMATDSLSRRIESVLREARRGATRAVERRVADASGPLRIIFAAPLAAWVMFRTLLPDERVMWLIWTWALVLLVRGYRRYRLRPSTTA
jgi:hypothetical protein